jgi:hypothetical protein
MTLQGRYIRVAYNNEGYAIVGYRTANQSVGEEWMLLDVGLTLRDGVPSYTLKREALSLETPDGKTIPLPTNVEYRKADLSAMQNRAKASRDPINYFPPKARTAQRLGFFADLDSKSSAWDQVELSFQRGTVGEVFFPVPGGIKYGQYWLNVKFKESLVRVPFRILTEKEYKLLDKNFEDIKQVDEAFRRGLAGPPASRLGRGRAAEGRVASRATNAAETMKAAARGAEWVARSRARSRPAPMSGWR